MLGRLAAPPARRETADSPLSFFPTPVQARGRRAAARAWAALAPLTADAFIATLSVCPRMLDHFHEAPWGWGIPIVVVGALAAAAFAVSPALLPASTGTEYGLS